MKEKKTILRQIVHSLFNEQPKKDEIQQNLSLILSQCIHTTSFRFHEKIQIHYHIAQGTAIKYIET